MAFHSGKGNIKLIRYIRVCQPICYRLQDLSLPSAQNACVLRDTQPYSLLKKELFPWGQYFRKCAAIFLVKSVHGFRFHKKGLENPVFTGIIYRFLKQILQTPRICGTF